MRSASGRHNADVRILGIDPGSLNTGFGVIDYERGKLALVEQGTIATRRGAELPERLAMIHDGLCEVIARTRAHCQPGHRSVQRW